jgi:hypothetical protein
MEMRERHILAIATFGAVLLWGCIWQTSESQGEEARPPDGPWHGSVHCIASGTLYAGTRTAQFEVALTDGKGTMTAPFDQGGELSLQVVFKAADIATLSVHAQSGDSLWPPTNAANKVVFVGNALNWTIKWARADCNMVLLPGPLPADAIPPKQEAVAPAPNDPEVRAASSPAAPGAHDSQAVELAFWETVKDAKEPGELQAYLTRYPTGAFAELAKIRLARLAGK